MSVDKLLESMTPEVYEKLRTAVEIGKWESGIVLTQAQKDSSLQAVMLYQSRFNTEPEHFTIGTDGEIAMLKKAVLKQQFRDKKVAQEEEILRIDVE
ncbi:MAG: hypothetical protein ACI9LG_000133 [Moritella dasanensis]|jgi:uncharacterized protein YeaC (DUF1315 family)